MAAKGSLWSKAEVQCLLDIWADENIQEQLDKTHKNSEVYGQIRDYLLARGYPRTIEQCRDKVKKLRAQYVKIRAALRSSESPPEEKEKFLWYDAVDKIIGLKPSGKPNVLECHLGTPSAPLEIKTEETGPWTGPTPAEVKPEEPAEPGPTSPQSVRSPTSDQSHTGDETQANTFDTGTLDGTPTQPRKRKKLNMDVSDLMATFLDFQRKQHDEFMRGEQLRHQQEMEMLDKWMKAQMELEGRRQQAQREERQEANTMFQQMMSRLFDAMVPFFQQHTPSHHPPTRNYANSTPEETLPTNHNQPHQSAHIYHNL